MYKYIVAFIILFMATSAFAAVTATVTAVEKNNEMMTLSVTVNDNGTVFNTAISVHSSELDGVSTVAQFKNSVINPKIMEVVTRIRKANSAYTFIQSNLNTQFTVQ